jgi:hypothetical protein
MDIPGYEVYPFVGVSIQNKASKVTQDRTHTHCSGKSEGKVSDSEGIFPSSPNRGRMLPR